MRWLVNVLKSRTFWISFGFLLLIGLVLLIGAWLGWAWELRLLGVIIVLMLGIGTLALIFIRENRSADALQGSIKQQAKEQVINTRPDGQAEIQKLQTQLEHAIEQIKQSKLGRGKRGRAALYALPWYLFIGPPGAGKTTAIANSGLNFPLGSDRTHGVGGTRNCDWFFSDQAILLDTAGRYMTEQEDTDEWLAFLDMLKQHRTKQPINGVIVGIALASDNPEEFALANASPDQINEHADYIRRRADELVQRLGVRFPVYLVFTKCDMLQGFVEFFGEMTQREREQIWGCTFDEEQQDHRNLHAIFEKEFGRLISALINHRSARLRRSLKREQRRKVYAFPLQLAKVEDNLSRFVGRLFQPNPYQENPIFRGFYFTSGTQEGVPLDQVIEAIAHQFELPPTSGGPFDVHEETKSYFIKDFFAKVVIPDQYMVRRTSKRSRRGSIQRVGVMVAAALLLGLFVLGTMQALIRSRASLNQALATANSTSFVSWDDRTATLDNLAHVDELRQEVERLGKSPLLGLGLYRNGTAREPAQRLFLDHAQAFVRAYPLQALERRMRLTTRAQVPDTAREALTADLKAYLLLTHFEEASTRLNEAGNRSFLIRYLSDLATDELESQARGITRGEVRARIDPQVRAFVEALREDVLLALAPEVTLIQNARDRLHEPLDINTLYRGLRLEGRGLRPFTLADVPGRYKRRLVSNVEVSGFFTKHGWETSVQESIEEVSRNPTGENWVMGRTDEDIPVDLGSEEVVAAKLQDLYFSDYAAAWTNFLRSVRVRPFGDLREVARGLAELSDRNDSPIAYLLAHITDQTFFEDVLDERLEGVTDAIRRRGEGRIQGRTGIRLRTGQGGDDDGGHPVNQRLRWLHHLQAGQFQSGDASGELYAAFDALRETGNQLDDLAGDAAQAAAFAGEVLKTGGGDLNRHLRAVGNALNTFNTEARNHLFEAPLEQAWRAVLATAQAYLNQRWREDVYERFQNSLASFYPFNPNTELDAPIFDVDAFFNLQDGAVPTFIHNELELFIGRDIDRPTTWRGRGISLSPSAREAIRQAQRIGSDIFTGGRMQVTFELQPEQPEKTVNAPPARQVSIRLLGKEDTYQLGFQRWTAFEWPGAADAVLIISTQEGDLPALRYEGVWALFRMLQQAGITLKTRAEFELRWVFERPGQYTITARYNLRTERASNPFGNPRGFFSFRPPSSLN